MLQTDKTGGLPKVYSSSSVHGFLKSLQSQPKI
jgi:hypothetical protein